MPSEKRRRQDEGRLNRRVQQVTATKRQRRTHLARNVGIIVAVALVGALLYSLLASSDDDDTVDTAGIGSTTTVAPAPDRVTVTYPGPGAAIDGETACPPADGSAERTTSFTAAPPMCIDAAKTYTALVETSEGNMTFALDAAASPNTVNNFVVLARYRYYEGIPFHRIIPGFVDQAGTPVDQASPEIQTNPGYTFADELPEATDGATVYPDGTLAMANSGANTNSSQFFIVVDQGGAQLEVKYSPFGKVTEGLDVAKAINGLGGADGIPTKVVTIDKVTISES